VLFPPLGVLVVVLDRSTLGQPENHSVCSEMHDVWAVKVVCDAKAMPGVVNCPHREYYISSRGLSYRRCLVGVQDEGWTVLCSLTNKTQDMNQKYHISHVGPRKHRNLSIYIPSSRLHLLFLFLPYYTQRQDPELSRHHVTYPKQLLSFQNTPDSLQNFVLSLGGCFRYMQLYHNANAWM